MATLVLAAAGFFLPGTGPAEGWGFVYRVSAGGYVPTAGPAGRIYAAEDYFSGGDIAGPFDGDVAGTEADDLYRQHRHSSTARARR